MEKLEYNMKIWEKKKKVAHFQMISAVLAIVGLLLGSLSHIILFEGPVGLPYGKLGLIAFVIILFFFLSISSWTNYSFLYHYFHSQWIGHRTPDELELVTGTIEFVETVRIPYAGTFKRLTVRLYSHQTIRLYIKSNLFTQSHYHDSVRLLTYHMFVCKLF